jgi:PEP-CTERM motif-containing protein
MSIRKPALLFVCFCLVLPLSAWANSVASNSGGQITSNGVSLTLTGSTLVGFNGLNFGSLSGNLGMVSLTTGSLISGSLSGGGTFAAGGSFTITGNGTNGLPTGLLFKGTFTGPVTWTATWVPNADQHGTWVYTLKGNISGTLFNGRKISGTIIETTFDIAQGKVFSTSGRLDLGSANLTVPEPGTLGLLATGLTGLAMLIRRKSVNHAR